MYLMIILGSFYRDPCYLQDYSVASLVHNILLSRRINNIFQNQISRNHVNLQKAYM
jgi:hypothetical protein